MITIKRFNGEEELKKLLLQFTSKPTNTEIIEKTGFSKGAVSGIMNGKVKPSKSFIDAFKKGFNITDQHTPIEKEKPLSNDSGLKDKMIQLLESSLKRVEEELARVLEENERLKNR